MSQRLDSLNGKKTPAAAKSSLKFKPKVVARKSKEERDKDAPVIKQETSSRNHAASSRGRGSTRGRGRGGRANYAGTSLVTAGPLAAGTVSLGVSNSSSFKIQRESGPSASPTPEFLNNLKLKEPPKQRSLSPEAQDDDAEDEDTDITRINMNREYRFADEETVLFPVRPTRKEPPQEILLSRESTVEPYSRENSASPPPPPLETGSIKVKQEDSNNAFSPLGNQYSTIEPIVPISRDPSDESAKLVSDHRLILHLVTKQIGSVTTNNDENSDSSVTSGPSEEYILLQMPKLLPKFEPPAFVPQRSPVMVKQEIKSEEMSPVIAEQEPEAEPEHKHKKKSKMKGKFASDISKLSGQIGRLNIHKSGKISVTMADNVTFNVTKGTQPQFLQEVCMIELGPDNTNPEEDIEMLDENGVKVVGKTLRMGNITDKVILTPAFS